MPNFKVEISEPKSGGNVFEVKTLTMREAIKKVLDSRESTGPVRWTHRQDYGDPNCQ